MSKVECAVVGCTEMVDRLPKPKLDDSDTIVYLCPHHQMETNRLVYVVTFDCSSEILAVWDTADEAEDHAIKLVEVGGDEKARVVNAKLHSYITFEANKTRAYVQVCSLNKPRPVSEGEKYGYEG